MRELSEHDKQLIVGGVPEANLAGYWPALQGRGGTLIDRSRNANHGTILGATWERLPRGLWWNKLDDTDDTIDCGTDSSLAFTTAFSLVFCFEIHTERNYHDLFTRGQGNIDGYWLGLEQSPGPGAYRFIFDTSQAGAFTRTQSLPSDFASNTIYMGAMVFGSGNTTFYKNGLPLVGGGAQTAPVAGVRTFYIGKGNYQSFPCGCYVGLSRAVGRDLSAAEILRDFTRKRHLLGI